MTKRTPAVGTTKSTLLATAASATAPVASSEEKTPEEKAAIAAVAQAPIGAAEPFGVTTATDVVKNVVASDMVAAAVAAGDPLALASTSELHATTASLGTETNTFDGAERAIGAPDVADQLGGPISRAPAVAAAAEAIGEAPVTAPVRQDGFFHAEDTVHERGSGVSMLADIADSGRFDAISDLAGRTFMVRSASDRGRRRAGIGFGPVAVPVDVDDLTPEQLGAILSDRQLFAELLPREL
jgi:hypothetical protein